jgi:hypothetical protein
VPLEEFSEDRVVVDDENAGLGGGGHRGGS